MCSSKHTCSVPQTVAAANTIAALPHHTPWSIVHVLFGLHAICTSTVMLSSTSHADPQAQALSVAAADSEGTELSTSD